MDKYWRQFQLEKLQDVEVELEIRRNKHPVIWGNYGKKIFCDIEINKSAFFFYSPGKIC